MKYVKSILIYGSILLCTSNSSYGQCDPVLKTDSAEILFDGTVNKFAVQDNYMYAGGNFSTVGKFSGSFIGIDKKTGEAINRTTWPKVNGPSNVIADGSGNYIIYGSFDKVDGIIRQSLAMISATGTLTSFTATLDGAINAAVVYAGVLYIGGYFTNVNGQPRNHLAAINLSNGVLTTWDPNVTNSGPLPCRIDCMWQNSSNIYIGGAFSNIGAIARKNIAVIDASTGLAGSWAPQAYFAANPNYGNVSKMLKVNNLLYICGGFDFVGGSTHGDIAAIDLTTGNSTSWRPDPNSVVMALASKGDTLYLGGAFYNISGLPRKGFAAYSITSGSLLPISIDTKKILNERIYSILPVGDTLYLGGTFDTINNQVRKNLGAFNRFTGAVLPWTSHTNGDVTSLVNDNGKLYAAGSFFSVGRKLRSYLAAVDLDADTVVPWNPKVDGEVTDLNIRNKILYIGGEFSKIDDSVRSHNAAWNIKTGKVLPWNPRADKSIQDIELYKNAMYIAGNFSNVGGQPHYGLAKLDSAGNVQPWTGINASGSTVSAIEIYKDTLYVGGLFPDLVGQTRNNLGAINLANMDATSWQQKYVLQVYSFFLKNDTIYAAIKKDSIYNAVTSSYEKRIIVNAYRLNYTGSNPLITWSTYPYFDDVVNDIVVTADNRLYVVGAFHNVNAKPRPGMCTFAVPAPAPVPPPITTALLSDFNPPIQFNYLNTVSVIGNKLFFGGNLIDLTIGYDNALLFHLPYVSLVADIVSDTNAICSGIPVTVRAKSSISFGATYAWFQNGASISNILPYYTFIPANNDSISCVVTAPANTCILGKNDTTNSIIYKVTQTVTPDISISGPVDQEPGKPVTIKALVKDAASGYTIEWFNKGISVGKTTVDSFTYTKGAGEDSMYAVITPRTDTCYVTDTSGLVVVAENTTGIIATKGDTKVIVYPNPFDTYVKVAGLNEGDILSLYDVTGRKMSTAISSAKSDYLLETGRLKAGVYVLKITTDNNILRKTLLIQKQ